MLNNKGWYIKESSSYVLDNGIKLVTFNAGNSKKILVKLLWPNEQAVYFDPKYDFDFKLIGINDRTFKFRTIDNKLQLFCYDVTKKLNPIWPEPVSAIKALYNNNDRVHCIDLEKKQEQKQCFKGNFHSYEALVDRCSSIDIKKKVLLALYDLTNKNETVTYDPSYLTASTKLNSFLDFLHIITLHMNPEEKISFLIRFLRNSEDKIYREEALAFCENFVYASYNANVHTKTIMNNNMNNFNNNQINFNNQINNFKNNNQNYNNFNNNFIKQNNNQEVLLGTFSGFDNTIQIFGYITKPYNITYKKIRLPNNNNQELNVQQNLKFIYQGFNLQFDFSTHPPKLYTFSDNQWCNGWWAWQPANQQVINNQFNNNFNNNYNQNFNKNINNNMMNNNFGNNFNNNFNVTQPSNAAAVEQGQVGVYDEDTKLLMDVLNNGGKLKDNGFDINPEDGGKKSIIKNGKVLFIGKIKGNQLMEGQLNVKFTKKANSNEYEPTEYYVGKFKDNLFEDTQGKYVFEERYNTGIQEKFEGNFSQGKPHGQVTFYNANGLQSKYEYDHGKIISQGGFRSMQDTDVIVFDSAISFQDAYTDRYANNFHIVGQEVYDKKKEDIFGKGDDAVKMPTAKETPNEEQQKMMEFIQKYILAEESLVYCRSDYIANFCHDSRLIKTLNECRSFIDSSEKMEDFVAKMKKEFFGDNETPISKLIVKNDELKEKWLCFVVDKIGMRAFNEMYAMKNLEHFVNKIQNNGNKKLKVVFSNHGSSSLHLFQDNEVFSAKWVDNLMATIKSLKRDTYVVNQSCYGGEKLDKNSFSKRIFNAEDLRIDNYKTNRIVSNELMEKLQTLKEKYKDKMSKFKQLMSFKEDISFVSKYYYCINTKIINYQPNDNLKNFMSTLFGIQGQQKGNLKFSSNNGQKTNIITEYSRKDSPLLHCTAILANQKQELLGGDFLTSSEIQLNNEIFNQEHISNLFNYTVEFPKFYAFLDGKIKQSEENKIPCNLTAAEAEQEFVKQRLEKKCEEIGIDYQQFKEFEKDFEELKEENNKTFLEWKDKFNDKIDESISEFLNRNNLLDPLNKVKMDFEKKMIEFEDADELPSDDKINQTIKDMQTRLDDVKEQMTKSIENIINKLQGENCQTFIENNFKSLYDFCVNNKDIKFENIFDKNGMLSQENLTRLFSNAKTALDNKIENEKNNIGSKLSERIMNQQTLSKRLMSLKQKGFDHKIVYSKNLSNKMIHYTNKQGRTHDQYYSNQEEYMMYHIIDETGKCRPLVNDVEGFKKSLKEFEAELEKQSKTKREGENFGEAFHDIDTITIVLLQQKFNKLREYIKEAKGNKNILLGYKQPDKLKNYKLTVDVGEQQLSDSNNNSAHYNMNSKNAQMQITN